MVPVRMSKEKTNRREIIFLRQEPAEIAHSRTGVNNNKLSSACPDLKACGVSAVAQGGGSRRRNGSPATPDSDSHVSFSFSPTLYHNMRFRAAFGIPGSIQVSPGFLLVSSKMQVLTSSNFNSSPTTKVEFRKLCRGCRKPIRQRRMCPSCVRVATDVKKSENPLVQLVQKRQACRHYNGVRPHSVLGYRPTAPEAIEWPKRQEIPIETPGGILH